MTLYVRHTLEVSLREQLEMRGVSIAADLGARSTDLLLTNNIYALHTLVYDTVNNNEDLRYAFVLDERGQVAAHSFDNGFPRGLREANSASSDERSRLQLLWTEEGWVWDVAAPILGGRAGTARVGLSESRLSAAVGSITNQLLVATGLASALGLVAAFLLTWILTRPILELVSVTRSIGQGDLKRRAPIRANDEIGRLGQAFNRMVADLSRSREESDRYDEQLRRRNRELAAINAVTSTVGSPLDLRLTLDRALAAALDATGFEIGWVTLLNAGHKDLVCCAGLAEEIVRKEAAEPSTCLCQQAIEQRRPSVITLCEICPARAAVLSDGQPVTCHATAPLMVQGRTLGVLNVASSEARPFFVEDLNLLSAIAQEIAVAVENARLWEELKQKEELRGRLLDAVITAQEEERKRVARELHDETGQAITSLMVGLRVAAEAPTAEEMRTQLGDLRAIAVQALADLRALARELRPSLLDDLGLEAALKRYVGVYSTKSGVDVDLEIIGFGANRRLLPQVELTLFRIIQEALTNVAKHARAHNVSAVLEWRAGSVVAVVEDDGVGFDVAKIMSSSQEDAQLGLHGMRERALLVGGQLELESTPGHGTTVYVEIPVEGEPSGEAREIGVGEAADTAG
ncbi:MAG: HAMP domain-containing protein [Chloroflexi bacterium]|nr:HAMP domain-containing protein [Chloroflexota bacterium]